MSLFGFGSRKQHTLTWRSASWGDIYRDFRDDIFRYAYWMGFKPTPQQAELMEAINEGQLRVACKSGQGPGKTTVSSLIGPWWTFKFEDTLTIITAPSMKQCREVWLAEVRRRFVHAHPKLKKFVKITKSQIHFGGKKHPNWKCLPITAATPEAFQGFHQDNMNAIVEEGSGMADAIIEALKGTVSNTPSEYTPNATEGSILMIGNPTRREGAFFDCFHSKRESGGWVCITFNAEESPIVSPRKIAEHEAEFGRDSDFYRVRVLGEFPSMDPRAIINIDDLDACVKTPLDVALAAAGGTDSKRIGIDVARQGGDETVMYRRLGGAVIDWKFWPKQKDFEPADAINYCFKEQLEAGWSDEETVYIVDASGMGQGVLSHFRDGHKEYVAFHNHGTASQRRMYYDKISEAWFGVARLARERSLLIPNDPVLIQQLSDRQYQMKDKSGRSLIKVESKDEYIKRITKSGKLARSPDRADAFVMAFYQSVSTRGQVDQLGTPSRHAGPDGVTYDT